MLPAVTGDDTANIAFQCCRHLQLLCDSSTRLDINAIKAHPFFHGMAWDDPDDPCWTPCWVPELRDGEEV